jgi:CRP/FNR family transcriptional regulator
MYPVDLLFALPYFQALERSAVEALARQMSRRDFQTGEAIFFEGEPAAGMWLIERGRVKVFKLNPEGEEHILRFLGPGNTFNDIAAFDGGTNPANTAALAETTLWLLPTDALHRLLQQDARVAARVVRLLAGQVRSLVGQVEDLALYSVTIRLARFLLKQAEDPALSGPGITRAAIAAHLATKPETVSRSLRSLEESGAIQFDRHRILIVREDILKAIAAL